MGAGPFVRQALRPLLDDGAGGDLVLAVAKLRGGI
jgi:hypothetical protein